MRWTETMFDSKLHSVYVCEATSSYVSCKCLPVCNVFISASTHLEEPTCMCLCTTGVCTYAFIGLCAKRSSNLIAARRVSACDSRYIQTHDQYLDRLSDNDSSGRYGQLLQYVCFPGLWGQAAWPPSTVHGPKAKRSPHSTWTD